MSIFQLIKVCVSLVLLAGNAVTLAQNLATENLLKGKQVTKDALINALGGDSANGQPGDSNGSTGVGSVPAVKTRGLRLSTPPEQASKAHKASLLITFAVDSAKLTKESMGLLDTMADAMQSKSLAGSSYLIEGHADPRGDENYNMSLSHQRAESVATYLVERHGIPKASLAAKGKGSSELLNAQQLDSPENRRVTFVNLKQ
jgi:outer membrane protein OmpA-like peptidoglycan-associated protein